MPIDEKIFRRLRKGFSYLEEYDKFGGRPDKRVPVSITIPLHLKRKLERKGNVSRFVEKAIEKAL